MFGRSTDDALIDRGEFDPATLPEPGPFLESSEVLVGDEHVAFHEVTRAIFEARGVYDVTFGYNLADLNRDTRHPGSGYRYGRESRTVVRAEFTPTTEFCPQSRDLAVGSFRAWNGLDDRHDYDLVRVHVHPMHHQSEAINRELDHLANVMRGEEAEPDRS